MSNTNLTKQFDALEQELVNVEVQLEAIPVMVDAIAKQAFILGYKQAQADIKAVATAEPTNKEWEEARVVLGLN